MDRGAWRATVHGVTRVRHDLETEPPGTVWEAHGERTLDFPERVGKRDVLVTAEKRWSLKEGDQVPGRPHLLPSLQYAWRGGCLQRHIWTGPVGVQGWRREPCRVSECDGHGVPPPPPLSSEAGKGCLCNCTAPHPALPRHPAHPPLSSLLQARGQGSVRPRLGGWVSALALHMDS